MTALGFDFSRLDLNGRAFTGAWIETTINCADRVGNVGRAFTGAWIETHTNFCQFLAVYVAPSRARGLKHESLRIVIEMLCRAFTGAWIETL